MFDTIKKYLSLVTFSHTIFALPFAIIGFFLGLKKVLLSPTSYHWTFENHFVVLQNNYLKYSFLFLLVVLCMVFARSAAMAFNRYLDSNIDELNPRTKEREIPSGKLTRKNAFRFVLIMCIAFVLCTYFINPLCFALSPVALAVVLFYSFTKRFTSLCHLVLGVGLALAPVGAFAAMTSTFDVGLVFLGLAVLFWVSGFDIIYALQDEEFDKSQNLKSIPVWLGKSNAVYVSRGLHFLSALFLVLFGFLFFPFQEILFWIGYVVFIFFLIYQHTLFTTTNLTKVNRGFMTTNGRASLLFGVFTVVSIFIYHLH